METVQIRLPEEQLKKIDKEVKEGRYQSRSAAIRDYLARMEFLNIFNEFQGLVEKEGLDTDFTRNTKLRDLRGTKIFTTQEALRGLL